MRLLVGPRPDVDVAVLEELALPAEGSVMRRERLQDEVVRFPEAIRMAHRHRIGRMQLVGHALHEPHLEAAARDHVDHRELFGDAQRIRIVRDRKAKAEQPGALGRAREDAEDEIGRGREARRGAVVLVDEDVEAELVGQLPGVEIFVIEVRGLDRIDPLVRQRRTDRDRILVPGVGIGLFGEVIDAHGAVPQAANAAIRLAKSPGCSMCAKRPARSIVSKRAPGMARTNARP